MSKKFKVEVEDEDYEVEAETADEAWLYAHQRVVILVEEIEEEEE
tara:strand:- start:994 stop:1128 length:135 start_codon:yes stop_codon:yes gene_type:complete